MNFSPAPAGLIGAAKRGAFSASDHGAINFHADTWRKWLDTDELAPALASFESALDIAGGPSISRNDLGKIATSGADDLTLFLATMAWGRGNSNGRMRDAFKRTLADDRLPSVLVKTKEAALSGDPAAAHRAWEMKRGIREPFFTKWLWASTLSDDNLAVRPLILDGRVWASLGKLRWSSLTTAGTRNRSQRYAAYVLQAHEWAKEASEATGRTVSPEDVEYWLFMGMPTA